MRSATLPISWPDGVHVAVSEEVPRLVVSKPGALGRHSATTAGSCARRPLGHQAGAAHGSAAPGPRERAVGQGRRGLRVASTLPASFVAQVTAVTVEPAGWVQLSLTTPVVVDVGSAAELTAKYEDVSSILAGGTLHDGDVIDVSVPDAATVSVADVGCLTGPNAHRMVGSRCRTVNVNLPQRFRDG